MAQIALRKVPDEVHRFVKRMQLDREDEGEKITLEEIYMELIQEAIKIRKQSKDK